MYNAIPCTLFIISSMPTLQFRYSQRSFKACVLVHSHSESDFLICTLFSSFNQWLAKWVTLWQGQIGIWSEAIYGCGIQSPRVYLAMFLWPDLSFYKTISTFINWDRSVILWDWWHFYETRTFWFQDSGFISCVDPVFCKWLPNLS